MDDAYKRREKVRPMCETYGYGRGNCAWPQRSKFGHSDPIPERAHLMTGLMKAFEVDYHINFDLFFLFCFLLSSGTFKYKLVPWRNFRRQLFGVQSNTSVWMSYCVKELSWNWTQAVFVNVTFQTHLKHKLWLMVHFELGVPISLPFIFRLSVALSFTLFLRKCGCEQIHTSPSLPPIGFWEWTPRI